jgi:ligand-binding sensor domain-containing protein
MFRFLALISACLLCNSLFAQENVYQFSHLDISNGLSDNQVNSIYKDQKGFMWFGTTAGLSRYDGHEFKTFQHNSKDSTSLPDGYIVKIFGGPRNELWIKSNRGFSIYNPLTEKFERFQNKLFEKYKIPGGYLREIKTNNRGKFYLKCRHFLLRCQN